MKKKFKKIILSLLCLVMALGTSEAYSFGPIDLSPETLELELSNSNTPIETDGQTAALQIVDFWLEAECAEVGSAWTFITDSNASGGNALTYTGGSSTGSAPTNASDRVRFNINVEVAGDYELYTRSIAPNTGSDSYWVSVNGGSWIRYNYVNKNNNSDSEYYWDQVGDWISGSDNTALSFNLSTGNNTIDIAYRENDIVFDKLFVTLNEGQPNDIGLDDLSCSDCIVGGPCDDGDASTVNDAYTSDCLCEGQSDPQSRYALQTGNIPGTIEAEYYDDGGQGIAHNDDTDKSGDASFRPDSNVDSKAENGTYIVGWTNDGEWIEYTVDVAAGTYDVTLVGASGNSNPGNVKVELDGIVLTTIDVTSTGSWATYQDFTNNDITLSAGTNQVLKLTIVDGAKLDIDKIIFTQVLCNGIDVSLIGTPCEDGDSCTTGETYDNNCDCTGGVSSDSDNDGVCDANDVCNGMDDALIGTSCDDGDVCTTGETYDSDCGCSGGIIIDSDNDGVCDMNDLCNGMDDALIGTPCEDGDSCTTGETYDNNCDCTGGVATDSDNDGVCDANDICNGMDDALIGTSCDDGDACTTGETYDSNCACSGGILIDSDNDGVCDANDVCNGMDDALIGTFCDDGDASTVNDVYTSDCICEGEIDNNPQSRYALQTGNIPGTIEAEYYDDGGQGIAYNDDTDKDGDTSFRSDTYVDSKAENGTYIIGWTNDGEWIEYTVDVAAGVYDVTLVASSGNSNPGNVEVELDGVLLTTIDVTSTGSYTSYQNFTNNNITLSAGTNQVLKLTVVDGAKLDIDKIIFTDSTLPPNPDQTDFYFEAECATVGSSWTQVNMSSASNGVAYTYTGSNSTGSPIVTPDALITFTFDVNVAGSYEVYTRSISPGSADDSYWVRSNNDNWIKYNFVNKDNYSSTDFYWDQVGDWISGTDNTPVSFNLSQGTNTIDIAYRENGITLDKIYVTLDSGQPTTIGDIEEDCLVTAPPTSCEWHDLADSKIRKLESASAKVNDKIYVFSGFTYGLRILEETEIYDPATNTHSYGADMPIPVTHAGCTVVGDEVWIVAGFEGNHPGVAISNVQIYNTVSDTWSVGPGIPGNRASGAAVYLDGRVHFFGGLFSDRVTDSGNHWYIEVNNIAAGWQTAAPMPNARNHFSGAALNGLIYAIGGQYGHDNGTSDQKLVDAYDFSTDSWTSVQDIPVDRSHFEPGTIVHNGRILIAGGRNGDLFYEDILEYDPQSDTWGHVCNLPDKLLAPSAKIIGNKLIIINGGLNGTSNPLNDTRYIYIDPEGDATGQKVDQSELIETNGAKVYPNPMRQSFSASVEATGETIKSIEVYDMQTGKRMHHLEVDGEEIIGIDFDAAPCGKYMVKINTMSGKYFTEIIFKL